MFFWMQEHKIMGDDAKPASNSKYLTSFYKQFDSNPKRFMITRG